MTNTWEQHTATPPILFPMALDHLTPVFMDKLLQSLSDREFEDLLRYHDQNKTDREIATLTGIPTNVVKVLRGKLPKASNEPLSTELFILLWIGELVVRSALVY